MANPQLEDGYTRLANEIMEALAKIRIPGEARQVLDVIIRKTYGYSKKWDAISLSQFAQATGLKRPNVCRAVITLDTMCIIKKDTSATNKYMFNKNFDEWKPLSKTIPGVSKAIRSGIVSDNKVVSKAIHTKEKKETIQKKSNMSTTQFVDLYHRLLPFGSKVVSLTKTRKAHINARLKQYPDPQFWTDLFARCARSKFLRGEIPPREGYKQFKINIEFITNENKIAKILEGEYDDRSGKPRQLTWRERQDISGN